MATFVTIMLTVLAIAIFILAVAVGCARFIEMKNRPSDTPVGGAFSFLLSTLVATALLVLCRRYDWDSLLLVMMISFTITATTQIPAAMIAVGTLLNRRRRQPPLTECLAHRD